MDFVAAAYTYKHEWWRYFLTIVLTFLLGFSLWLGLLLFLGVWGISRGNPQFISDLLNNGANIRPYEDLFCFISWYAITLCTFIFSFGKIHKSKIIVLFCNGNKIRISRFFVASGNFILVYVLIELCKCALFGRSLEFVLNPTEFIPYVVCALLFLPLQVSFEELLFRSYIGQALSLFIKRPIVIVIVTSVLFAIAHYGDMQIAESYSVLMLAIFQIGVALAISMFLDDGIELSIGLHFANNLLTTTLIEVDGERMSAIFKISGEQLTFGYIDILAETILYVILLLIFTKLYHWNWRRLLQKIERPAVEGAE